MYSVLLIFHRATLQATATNSLPYYEFFDILGQRLILERRADIETVILFLKFRPESCLKSKKRYVSSSLIRHISSPHKNLSYRFRALV